MNNKNKTMRISKMEKLFAGATQKLFQLMKAPGPFELIKVKNDSFLLRDSFIAQCELFYVNQIFKCFLFKC